MHECHLCNKKNCTHKNVSLTVLKHRENTCCLSEASELTTKPLLVESLRRIHWEKSPWISPQVLNCSKLIKGLSYSPTAPAIRKRKQEAQRSADWKKQTLQCAGWFSRWVYTAFWASLSKGNFRKEDSEELLPIEKIDCFSRRACLCRSVQKIEPLFSFSFHFTWVGKVEITKNYHKFNQFRKETIPRCCFPL